MNRRIAATDRWGVKEILARADDLADRAIRLWPPHCAASAAPSEAATGTFCRYRRRGQRVPGCSTRRGKVADGFRWGSEDQGDLRALLTADGIHFTITGAADPAQRLTSDDLALLVADAEDEPEEAGEVAQPVPGGQAVQTRAARFLRQLSANDSAQTVSAVSEVLARWEELGGWVGYGTGKATNSAFLMLGEAGLPGRGVWPLTLYPGGGRGGTAEVVFQHMATREPFTDRALRAELLARFNELAGVDIPEGKLEPRPNFPLAHLAHLAESGNRELLIGTLTWFRDRWQDRDPVCGAGKVGVRPMRAPGVSRRA
ncbi:hypothetical protein AB0H18_17480 [Streptomyces sp. NPDC020766]|uniref:hypothetical protein n=1 Tax=Streptomyces sp. NPDC020766 TaxID=3155011 RepID=UPI0033DDF288